MDENQICYLGRVEKNTIVLKQNSNRLTGFVRTGETKEIIFDKDCGCLICFYHPYSHLGLYGFGPYQNNNVTLITPIAEADRISLSLIGRTLKITSGTDYSFCIFVFPF